MDTIGFEDFVKVDLRVGLIEEVSVPEGSEKLLRLRVRFSDDEVRTIFAGMKQWYGEEDMKGKKFGFVYNLEPRKMMGEESQGMMLAVVGDEGRPILWPVPQDAEVGSKIR